MYPGGNDGEMPPIAILGTADEGRIMRDFRAMQTSENPTVRNGYLMELVRSRIEIGNQLQKELDETRVHQDIKYFWEELQKKKLWGKLNDNLWDLATNPKSNTMENEKFREIYEENVQAYHKGLAPYEVSVYDEEEAQKMHMQTFDF
jgi:hypothetical protein